MRPCILHTVPSSTHECILCRVPSPDEVLIRSHALLSMPFVPDGRGGYCKAKNKNYVESYVLLHKAPANPAKTMSASVALSGRFTYPLITHIPPLQSAPYGAASGAGHKLTEEQLALVGARVRRPYFAHFGTLTTP